jgi:hypothetical protein
MPPDLPTTIEFLRDVVATLTATRVRATLESIIRFAEKEADDEAVLRLTAIKLAYDTAFEAGFQQGVFFAQNLPAGLPEPTPN